MPRAALLLLILAVPLAGCGGSNSNNGPGGVSPDEAASLNDAAAMLDANSVDPQAVGIDNANAGPTDSNGETQQ